MAGERLHPGSWVEVSAACTHPAWRGHGFGAALVSAVAQGARARGCEPFLHVVADNLGAIGLYGRLGFEVRRELEIVTALAPPMGS
jgi:predicted GNAT family acetyltransferase